MTKTVTLALLFCSSLAVAWYWDVEQVDSAGWGASVEMRWQPNGELVMCYSDTLGNIRMAWPLPAPKYRDLPHWRSVIPGRQAFDIDSHGAVGLSYVGTDGRNYYALKTDTNWVDTQTPFFSPWSRSPTALDTAGNPVISVQSAEKFLLARRSDTQWVTTALMTGDAGMNPEFGCTDLGSKSDGTVWGVFRYSFSWPDQEIYGNYLYKFQVQDTSVNLVMVVGGAVNQVYCASGCVDDQGAIHASYGYWQQAMSEGLFLDATLIDSVRAVRTAVKYDALGRPQIAYVTWDDTLMYRYLVAGVWRVFDLQTTGLTALSLAVDQNQEPLIAYTTHDGLFLAHGVGVTGQSEETQGPVVCDSHLTAAVVRNVLFLPTSALSPPSSLLSVDGRKVVTLKPGANDVSRLSPGVYFVQKRSAVGGKRSEVHKVVMAK